MDYFAGAKMLAKGLKFRNIIALALMAMLLLPSVGKAYPSGIAGPYDVNGDGSIDAENDLLDVAKEGCTCHNAVPTNSVQIILDDVPYSWVPGQSYTMVLQLIGGPDINSASNTGGFSMRASEGSFTGDMMTQNGDDDEKTLTHTQAGATTDDRKWTIVWDAPAEGGIGAIHFWITGNSVDGLNGNGGADVWNQLIFFLTESDEDSGLGTRTLFAGDGNVAPPEPTEQGVPIHEMGAHLRAHWLGLLGFLSVVLVIIFAGFMLRYGFSSSYEGRSNLLRLRYKVNRRGDQ